MKIFNLNRKTKMSKFAFVTIWNKIDLSCSAKITKTEIKYRTNSQNH